MVTLKTDKAQIRAEMALQTKNPLGLYVILADEGQSLPELAAKLAGNQRIDVTEDGGDAVTVFEGYGRLDSIYRRGGNIYAALTKEG